MDELRIVSKKNKIVENTKVSNLPVAIKTSKHEIIENEDFGEFFSPKEFNCFVSKILTGHEKTVYDLDIYENKLISCSADKTIRIWDLKTGKALKIILAHHGSVWSVKAYDGKIISSSSDKTIRILDFNTGKLLNILTGHENQIYSIFIHDEKIISGSLDRTVRVWDLKTGNLLKTLKGHNAGIFCVYAHEEKIISGSGDGYVNIWNINTGELLKSIHAHKLAVTSIVVNGQKLITASKDKTIKIWDLTTYNFVKTLKEHKSTVWSIFVDSEKIFSVSDDRTMKVWDLFTGNLLDSQKEHRDWVSSIILTKTKMITSSADTTIKIWNKMPKHDCQTINLEKDVNKSDFETEKEYEKKLATLEKRFNSRLVSYDYIKIGNVEFLQEDYSIKENKFPFVAYVNCEKISKLLKIPEKFNSSIQIGRLEAEKLYNYSKILDLYIKFTLKDNTLLHEFCVVFNEKKYTFEFIKTTIAEPKARIQTLRLLYNFAGKTQEMDRKVSISKCNDVNDYDITKSPFETIEEFENRVKTKLLNFDFINIGKIELISSEYSIQQEKFPLIAYINCQKILNFLKIEKKFRAYIFVERQKAKDMHQTLINHDLFVKFYQKDDEILYDLSIIFKNVKYNLTLEK